MPDEETYNEQVQSDYCVVEDLPKDVLRENFIRFLEGIFPYIPRQIKGTILKDGVVKVTIPRGCIREFIRKLISEIKDKVNKLAPDDFVHDASDIQHLVDYVNPLTTVFVTIEDGGTEDYDTYRRSLAFSLEDNDKEDTVVYVYGSINHHV